MTSEGQSDKLRAEIDEIMRKLGESDKDVPRLAEDLISILVKKQVVSLAEFSDVARDKISNRMSLRARLRDLTRQIDISSCG